MNCTKAFMQQLDHDQRLDVVVTLLAAYRRVQGEGSTVG